MRTRDPMRAQISFEFIMMIGMGMILLVAFSVVINDILTQKNDAIREDLFNDLGASVQQELILASTLHPGYSRTITIPPADLNYSFDRYNYTLLLSEGYLIITQEDHSYSFPVPNITGNLHIGDNTLRNQEGVLYANS